MMEFEVRVRRGLSGLSGDEVWGWAGLLEHMNGGGASNLTVELWSLHCCHLFDLFTFSRTHWQSVNSLMLAAISRIHQSSPWSFRNFVSQAPLPPQPVSSKMAPLLGLRSDPSTTLAGEPVEHLDQATFLVSDLEMHLVIITR
jgi:hypothetical protein